METVIGDCADTALKIFQFAGNCPNTVLKKFQFAGNDISCKHSHVILVSEIAR